jgi:uncharacterized membrane protein
MKSTKILGLTICILLLAGIFLGVAAQPVRAMIDNAKNPPAGSPLQAQAQEQVVISTKYPVLSGTATTQFSFSVELSYTGGTEAKYFDLSLDGPDVFNYALTQSYGGDTNIVSVKLDPKSYTPEALQIKATPNIFNLPSPGEYTVTLTATSGNLKQSIDLKIVITARYGLQINTTGGVLSTQITPNKDNFFTINVTNTGTATLENINITSSVRGSPSNWEVTADPKQIDSLAPKAEKEVKINIKPPEKTISGDYEVTVTAKTEASNASDDVTIRVTALTQTIWGWVGVAIIVIVVAGLIAMFMFMGRR